MKKFKILGYMLICLIFMAEFAYGQAIQSSTIAAGGSAVSVKGKYYSHVVGQQSVSGTSTRNGITMRQGFKQPNLILKSIKKSGIPLNLEESNPITYTVFPNPFIDKLAIKLSSKTVSPSYLVIYDIMGTVKYEEKILEGIDEINLNQFDNFKLGKYILHIVYKGTPFSISILKEK